MDRRLFALPIALAATLGCAPQAVTAPSLAPRAAEAIDPRVPIPSEVVRGPVTPAVAARLAELDAQARDGNAAFDAAAANAERLASAAGPPQSESWITAQQALSAAQAAREPTTRALGDIDALAARTIAATGGISAADRAAIESAASAVTAIDQVQAARLSSIQARLGS